LEGHSSRAGGILKPKVVGVCAKWITSRGGDTPVDTACTGRNAIGSIAVGRYVRLLVQDDVQQRGVDFQVAVVIDEA
jgi:hypothetical protein